MAEGGGPSIEPSVECPVLANAHNMFVKWKQQLKTLQGELEIANKLQECTVKLGTSFDVDSFRNDSRELIQRMNIFLTDIVNHANQHPACRRDSGYHSEEIPGSLETAMAEAPFAGVTSVIFPRGEKLNGQSNC